MGFSTTLASACALISIAGAGITLADARSVPRHADPGQYVGEYTRDDGTPIYVVRRDDELVVVVTGNVFALEPAGVDRFELVGVAEAATFERAADGRVSAVSDSAGTYPRRTDAVPIGVSSVVDDVETPDYVYAPPSDAAPDLPVGDASAHGLPPLELERLVRDILDDPDYRHVHSLLVRKDGVLVLEEYLAGFDAARPHDLRSATKSVISALVGGAVLRGDVRLDDRPLAVIAGTRDIRISRHKASLTLAELLDMRHGLRCDDWDESSPGNERRVYVEADWTGFILAIPDAGETTGASYCSAVPLMVGRYLEIATGRSLPELADRTLFSALGIERANWRWDFDLRARETPHGAQVHLRPRDMLRFGALYERDGLTADGRRLLPEGWVRSTFEADMPLGSWRRYNDFWWAYDVERANEEPATVHAASGIAGQRIALVPDVGLIVVTTGGSFSAGRGGPRKIVERLVRAASD